MGLMCSWIAVKGAPLAVLLEAIGLATLDQPEEVFPGTRAVNFSYLEKPDGWIVIASEDIDWASNKRILELSRLGLTVGCEQEDKVEMESVATGAENGVELWRVYHNADPKKGLLEVRGAPPPEFVEIRDRLLKEQADNGGDEAGVDFLHDIPLDLAKAVCGYRLDDEEAAFWPLKPIGAGDMEAAYTRPPVGGLLGGIFNLFGGKKKKT